MNETVNKFLLAGDKFMSEMQSKGLVLLTVLAGHLQKTKKELKSYWRLEIQILLTKMSLIKPVSIKAYGESKDLAKRTQSDKFLRDKVFKIASDPKYDGYQRGLASMVYKFFDKKKYSWSGVANELNYQLVNEPHRQIIRKFKKRKSY